MKKLVIVASVAVLFGAISARGEFRQIDITTFGMD